MEQGYYNDMSSYLCISRAELAFDLKTYNTMDDYVRALSNVRYLGGNTNTAAALRMSSELIFTPAGKSSTEYSSSLCSIILFSIVSAIPHQVLPMQ